ncbi:MAG TPA: CbiX/SirB N-terminal domain-containing protein [Casimicrobiaceae bacterium]|jgi:sirohydrochlorin cobaltochelatase
MKLGLVLFAHGARDLRWAEPFEKLLRRVRALAPAAEVRLCYLELMQPDLEGAIAELVALGVDTIRVVPVFLGQGGHVRRDLPDLIAAAQRRFADTAIDGVAPAGEDAGVIDALARYCVGPAA